jgi:hypothetical protein
MEILNFDRRRLLDWKLNGYGLGELIRCVRALVYLQLQQMTGEAAPLKSEVLLERAGLSKKEIADILDKKLKAIYKSLIGGRTPQLGGTNLLLDVVAMRATCKLSLYEC